MKKIACLFVTAVLLTVFSRALTYADPVIFTVRSENSPTGESIAVTVRITAFPQTPVGGVKVCLSFDNSFFGFETASVGSAFRGASVLLSESENMVVFGWDDASGTMITNDQLLMTVTLNTCANTPAGEYLLAFNCIELYETATGFMDDLPYTIDCSDIILPAESITSDVFTVGDKHIGGIFPGTTANQLLNGIHEKSYVKIYKDTLEITGDTRIGTGMTVILADSIQTLTVIVTGDTDGDGLISIVDLVQIKTYLSGQLLSEAAIAAADVGAGVGVNAEDLVLIKQHLLGMEDIGFTA